MSRIAIVGDGVESVRFRPVDGDGEGAEFEVFVDLRDGEVLGARMVSQGRGYARVPAEWATDTPGYEDVRYVLSDGVLVAFPRDMRHDRQKG